MKHSFNLKNPKYRQACDDLKTITGFEFEPVVIPRSTGQPSLALRVLTPATYVPNYDVLSWQGDGCAKDIIPSKDLAAHMAALMWGHFSPPLSTILGDAIIEAVEVRNFLGIKEPSYKGALDFFAEATGNKKGIDYEKLHQRAQDVRHYNRDAAEPYQPPQLGELIVAETTTDMLEKINFGFERWVHAMSRLAGLEQPPFHTSPEKRAQNIKLMGKLAAQEAAIGKPRLN